MEYVIGVDIGGTNIRVALIDEELNICHKKAMHTCDITDTEHFILTLQEMILSVDADKKARYIGIVIPAPWTENMTSFTDVTNVKFLENLEIEQLKKAFPDYQLFIENDVNAIALLESNKGAASGSDNSIYITVSTGIGSGIIIDHKLFHGANGYAGEIGHMPVFSDKREANINTLEGICSGKALEKQSCALLGTNATAKDLFLAYESGNRDTFTIVERWLDDLSKGLATVIQFMDPQVIVMGGPLILNHSWVINELQKRTSELVMDGLSKNIHIREAMFGTDAGVIGAGYLALVK